LGRLPSPPDANKLSEKQLNLLLIEAGNLETVRMLGTAFSLICLFEPAGLSL
jgi:hypothetical protein